MRAILARANAGVLGQLARSRTLLAFDFDGTLAPIVSRPEDAGMRPRTAALFAAVCARYPCAIVSGRSRADVRPRLLGASVKYVVGNHGLEAERGAAAVAPEILAARPTLQQALRHIQGVEVEDKGQSLAIHYRRARSRRLAMAAILGAVRGLSHPVRVVRGKSALSLLPCQGAHKGDAVLRLMRLEDAHLALYVGDDVTDEDVFMVSQRDRIVSVRVGRSRSSAARYFVPRQRDIDSLLVSLLRERERLPRIGDTPPRPALPSRSVATRHPAR